MAVSLDYNTRKLIAEHVREAVRDEIRDAALTLRLEAPPPLQGPSAPELERYLLGRALRGERCPELTPDLFHLAFHRRVLGALVPGQPEATAAAMVELGQLSSDDVHEVAALADCAADSITAPADASNAVEYLRSLARDRRTVDLLCELAAGICNRSQSHETAYQALREFFAREREPEGSKRRQRGE